MSLESIYYLGQTIAVIAILGSLIAIFWQQRQANKIVRVQNSQGLSSAYANALRDVMNSADLAAIFRKVMFDDEELSPIEATRILLYFSVMLDSHQKAWLALEHGLYSSETLSSVDANTAWYLTKPIFLNEWKRSRAIGLFGGSFADHIDSLIVPEAPIVEPEVTRGE